MMKLLLATALVLLFQFCNAQNRRTSARDSLAGAYVRDTLDIKEQLVNLAIQNSGRGIDSANRNIALYNLNKAKNSWFNQIAVAGNINEFSITNSTVASYYPRYNFGITVPLGIFSTHSNDVKIAREQVKIVDMISEQKLKAIRRDVLSRYETFLEKRDILKIEKETVEDVKTTYIKAKADYTSSSISLDKYTDAIRNYNDELQKVRTADKNFNIAYLELEELVGFGLKDLLIQYGLLD